MTTAAQIRQRLWSPPNAVPDAGIDLKRHRQPEPAPIALTVLGPMTVEPPRPPSVLPPAKCKQTTAVPAWKGARREIPIPKFIDSHPPPIEPDPPIYPTIAAIIAATAHHYGISEIDVVSRRRNWAYVRPRQMAMYVAKKLTPRSYPEIGRRMGTFDHTTVLSAVKRAETRIVNDPAAAADFEAIKALIKGVTA